MTYTSRHASDVPDDLQLLATLAERLGVPGFSGDPETVFEELRRASAGAPVSSAAATWSRTVLPPVGEVSTVTDRCRTSGA